MALEIDLRGKKALVTGASDGVGAGVARMLARAGCDLAGTGRVSVDHPRAQAMIAAVEAGGRRATYLQGDLAHRDTPAEIVARAAEALDGLDIVVSNAGHNVFEGAEACPEEKWAENAELNLASHWRLGRAALPHLRRSDQGVLLVMTSNHAYATIPGCFPYNVTKTALLGLVRAMAVEWGPEVRVMGVAPGFIDTPGNQQWFDSFPDPAAERRRTEAMHPAGRLGTADEVGALCAYLASPLARFFTGSTVLMDGGRTALLQDENPF